MPLKINIQSETMRHICHMGRMFDEQDQRAFVSIEADPGGRVFAIAPTINEIWAVDLRMGVTRTEPATFTLLSLTPRDAERLAKALPDKTVSVSVSNNEASWKVRAQKSFGGAQEFFRRPVDPYLDQTDEISSGAMVELDAFLTATDPSSMKIRIDSSGVSLRGPRAEELATNKGIQMATSLKGIRRWCHFCAQLGHDNAVFAEIDNGHFAARSEGLNHVVYGIFAGKEFEFSRDDDIWPGFMIQNDATDDFRPVTLE